MHLCCRDRKEKKAFTDGVLESDGRSFPVHKCVVGAMSQYFEKMFCNEVDTSCWFCQFGVHCIALNDMKMKSLNNNFIYISQLRNLENVLYIHKETPHICSNANCGEPIIIRKDVLLELNAFGLLPFRSLNSKEMLSRLAASRLNGWIKYLIMCTAAKWK